MVIPPPLPPPFGSLPFHVQEAYDAGVPPARLRRADLAAPFRGIRAPRPLSTTEERCLAYLPLLGERRWFSHATAALLWGMWLPKRLQTDDRVHVSAASPTREPRTRGVIGHRVAASSVAIDMVRGLPVASAAHSWCELSDVLTLDELVIAGDSLLRRREPIADLEEVSEAMRRFGRRRGAALLGRAYPLLRSRADSPREVTVRLLLARAGLPEPVVNLPILDARGLLFGDLGYPEWRTIVEYDGGHHLRYSQVAADILRLERLSEGGWTVVRVVNDHLADPEQVVRRVARALAANGWRPTRSKLHLLR